MWGSYGIWKVRKSSVGRSSGKVGRTAEGRAAEDREWRGCSPDAKQPGADRPLERGLIQPEIVRGAVRRREKWACAAEGGGPTVELRSTTH